MCCSVKEKKTVAASGETDVTLKCDINLFSLDSDGNLLRFEVIMRTAVF